MLLNRTRRRWLGALCWWLGRARQRLLPNHVRRLISYTPTISLLISTCSYPLAKERRFHCANSNVCIDRMQLCDGIQDCENNDDEDAQCEWLYNSTSSSVNRRQFICWTGTVINRENHCNSEIDCEENGEDEYFCDIRELPEDSFSTFKLEEYFTEIIVYPTSHITVVRDFTYRHEVKSSAVQKLQAMQGETV